MDDRDAAPRPHPALPHQWQVTKYDPADRDEHGRYVGPEDCGSDHGPVEAAYLAAVGAFAADSGIDRLTVREPQVGLVSGLGDRYAVDAPLTRLFPDDLRGWHDGAQVSVPVASELVRTMLRDGGPWCRLECDDLVVHVGWDQYVYVGSSRPCARAVAFTRGRGLFAERITASPYTFDPGDERGARRPADAAFWAQVAALVRRHGGALLEEGPAHNLSRWHRLTADNLPDVRRGLAPRCRLLLWPDLSSDVDAVLARLPRAGLGEVVWQEADGRLVGGTVDEDDRAAVRARLRGARAATVISGDQRDPLLSAVLPDPDGALRARWTA